MTLASLIAGSHLLLVGGGTLPPAALTEFTHWAKDFNPQGPVLVVTWATSEPDVAFKDAQAEFAAVAATPVVEAPVAPLTADTRTALLGQVRTAGAVFFTGGDQTKVMDVLKDGEIAAAMRAAYARGLPFGGSSAGTEVMAKRMMTGNGDFTVLDGHQVETTPGLGLLPPGVLVDMHFVRRQRENRLFGLLLDGPETVGLGIDQDTAALLTDGRSVSVVGPGSVMVIASDPAAQTLAVKVLRDGDGYLMGIPISSSESAAPGLNFSP